MCQSIFVSAIESALFPVGYLCVYPCVCVCDTELISVQVVGLAVSKCISY